MRGMILGVALLATAATIHTTAKAASPASFKVAPVKLPTPRPIMTPRPVATPVHVPYCPPPPAARPLPVSAPKTPNYTKRSLSLVQQNIILMNALRAGQSERRCDPAWSARKLARKGCPPAQPAPLPVVTPEAMPAAAPVLTAPGTTIATASEVGEGQN